MDTELHTATIYSLPSEVVTLVLHNNDIKDILNFGFTCKQFYNLVLEQQLLWRDKLKQIIPKDAFYAISRHTKKTWFDNLKSFHIVRKRVLSELTMMSPKYYEARESTLGSCYIPDALEFSRFGALPVGSLWDPVQRLAVLVGSPWAIKSTNNITRTDYDFAEPFYDIALEDGPNYYYVIFILQELVDKSTQYLNNYVGIRPYTLTDVYYAQSILTAMTDTYLTVKRLYCHTNFKNEWPPEYVVNFFVQWADNCSMHFDDAVDISLMKIVEKVEKVLFDQTPSTPTPGDKIKEMLTKEMISEKQILGAITQVIYHNMGMRVSTTTCLQLLDIVQVINNCEGSLVAVGTIYHAVARRCGVELRLVAFPNHLLLEWLDISPAQGPLQLKVDLWNGSLKLRATCPYVQRSLVHTTYHPDNFLQYIVNAFKYPPTSSKHRATESFLNNYSVGGGGGSSFSSYLHLLMRNNKLRNITLDIGFIDLRYLTEKNIQLILFLVQYPRKPRIDTSDIVRKTHKRDQNVKFAVGMICQHKNYEYTCVVRDWDLTPRAKSPDDTERKLLFGSKQPHYAVMAADKSRRYIAQENLEPVMRPQRLNDLEENIATEFSHYNGFAYVPNDEKRAEYPDDAAVVSAWQSRADAMARPPIRYA